MSKAVDFVHPVTGYFVPVADRVIVVCKIKSIIDSKLHKPYIDIWFSYEHGGEWFQSNNNDDNMFEGHNKAIVHIKLVPTNLYDLVELMAKQEKFDVEIFENITNQNYLDLISKGSESHRIKIEKQYVVFTNQAALKSFGMGRKNFNSILEETVVKMVSNHERQMCQLDGPNNAEKKSSDRFVVELLKGTRSKYFYNFYYLTAMRKIYQRVQSCKCDYCMNPGEILSFLKHYE